MRTNVLIAALVVGLFGASGSNLSGQQGGRGRGGAAAPVPNLSTDKTMFWSAADLQARWKENEALKRINSRIFNGPTNISANVRIVLPGDPPQAHETTADLWIVTEGTATARTDGLLTTAGGKPSIINPTERPVKAGDVLYVPPGVPHHFTDTNGFRAWLIRFDTLGLVRTKPLPATLPQPTLATDKTMFWSAADIEARWKENEARKRNNSRIFDGPANISANVRIVLPGDEPLTHVDTADLWIVTAGEAVARTDGELANQGGVRSIRNGMSRPVHAGDVLYVPPGVPHHFTDVKGFRAWLIRFDVEGWRQIIAAPGGQN
jgi:mannose-6-phosphate isomerase-like protein (cupin superfamily)